MLNTLIERVPKISKRIVPALKHLGVKTIRDFLFYFPARYENFSELKKISEVSIGEIVTIQGKINKIFNHRTARKKMFLTEAEMADDTGKIKSIWFNQPFLIRNLLSGNTVSLSGKVAFGKNGIYLQNPSYEKIQNSKFRIQNYTKTHTGGLIPVYPETKGITSRWLRFLIKSFLELRRYLADPLPFYLRQKYGLPEIRQAIASIHFPKNLKEAEASKKRFIFEELFLFQLRALREKFRLKQNAAPVIPLQIPLIKDFTQSLPFSLTDAQRRSIWEIINDLAKPVPMNRLLEGDVGSGKTVVAAAASLATVSAGFKVIFMAPTEILAFQHFETFKKTLAPFKIRIGLLTGSNKKANADSQIIIGTHALIQKGVKFENLGMVIIDEQHRFGVEQRARLTRQGYHDNNYNNNRMSPSSSSSWSSSSHSLPHFLSMSATPIPRTLALTIYGDLDLSILDEMPKSRKQIITEVVEPNKRKQTYDFIKREVKNGRQIFVICPRIETDNAGLKQSQQKLWLAETKTVKEEYKKLSENIFPDFKIGVLHGRMKSKEKETVMKKFKNGELDILVSTSVVEVGVDIPNATIMMIEGAERFGLAQLHQFRGRVGRGENQSYCFLFPTEDGLITKRLRAVIDAKNGFELAEKDLEIRGAGDIMGTQQWGESAGLLLAGLKDLNLVKNVRNEASEIIKKDPWLKRHPDLQKRLEELEKTVHLE